MTSTAPPADHRSARPIWPWALLALALTWIVLVRVPLVLNAVHHLDSDLAVDGLTLAEAARGHWRWHYPGTPHMGTPPVLLSLPAAWIGGVNPITLVVGGVAAYALAVLATFWLAWRAFGVGVAVWALVPLTFASTGTLWLSGRITGGHLPAVAWHAATFALLHGSLRRRGIGRAAALGLWCGLGLYLDGMLLSTVLAVVAVGLTAWLVAPAAPRPEQSGVLPVGWAWPGVAFALALAVGLAPRVVGTRIDPYDAYGSQFDTIVHAAAQPGEVGLRIDWAAVGTLAEEHARVLLYDCLPRLLAGHRLPGYEAEPHPAALEGRAPPRSRTGEAGPVGVLATWLALGLALASAVALIVAAVRARDPADAAVSRGVLLASALVVIGFILNRNIYNSDNYRYLVLLLVSWALGFGVLFRWLAARGVGGWVAAGGLALALAVLLTADTWRWYERFGWISGGVPVRVERPDPALEWLNAHPKVEAIFGDYWDVYRLAFLTGGRVRGVPFPAYPDRYPEWSRGLPAGRPRILLVAPTGQGAFYEQLALRQGARLLERSRGVAFYDWPAK